VKPKPKRDKTLVKAAKIPGVARVGLGPLRRKGNRKLILPKIG